MIPVYQSTTGSPVDAKPHERGDCFSACLASILELPLAEVPRFCELNLDDLPPYAWNDAIQAFLRPRGLCAVEMKVDVEEWGDVVGVHTGYAILSGPSPRGPWNHSVVALGGAVVHDPHPDMHPSKAGDAPNFHQGDMTILFLVPFNPVFVRRHAHPEDS